MKKWILSLGVLTSTLLTMGQNASLNVNSSINQIHELENGEVLVFSKEVSLNGNDLNEKWATEIPFEDINNSTFYVSKSDATIFGIKNHGYGFVLDYLDLTAGDIGTSLKSPIELEVKGWDVFAHFVSESHMNFIIIDKKQNTKNGENLALRWLQFDKNLTKTERKLSIPSYGSKEYKNVKHTFICENNGGLVFINNYESKKNMDAQGETVLMIISEDLEVETKDLTQQFPIYSESLKLYAAGMSREGVPALSYQYLKNSHEIAFQVINEDRASSRLGIFTMDGDIKWERKEAFEKKIPFSSAGGSIRCSLSTVNDEFLLYNMASVNGGTGHCSMVELENGSSVKEFDFEVKNSMSIPSTPYLACLMNPNGQGKEVINSIQESIEKQKKLRNYSMGYFTTSSSEFIWITESFESKLYKFDTE